jgi:hypothetical protein
MSTTISHTIDNRFTIITEDSSIQAFKCPVPKCNVLIHQNPHTIATHIRTAHPKISSCMKLDIRPNASAYICYTCDSYTSRPHIHCHECENEKSEQKKVLFNSKQELDAHLNAFHKKWWFEKECKFGAKCRGRNGGCGFNHVSFTQTYLEQGRPVPSFVCKYDRPWDSVRCKRDKCSFIHFKGRVNYLANTKDRVKHAECENEHEHTQEHETSESVCYVEELAEQLRHM